jgi:hypothetical protein
MVDDRKIIATFIMMPTSQTTATMLPHRQVVKPP